MLIHPWDAALDDAEWQAWLATTDRFGVLAVDHSDPTQAPLLLPTHFTSTGDELLVHLARPNPAWPHLEAAQEVRLAVVGDHTYVPTYWRSRAGGPDEDGVPTSYYSAVQFVCRPTVVDEPQAKAALLAAQLADRQPEGRHAEVAVDAPPYGRMLPGIRGLRLAVLRVEAKFKVDDHNPVEHRERVVRLLEERGRGLDAGAAAVQRRRLSDVGDWRTRAQRASPLPLDRRTLPGTSREGDMCVTDRLRAATNAHDLEAVLACFTEDYRSEQPAHPSRSFTGRDQVRVNWSSIFEQVPDFSAELRGHTHDDAQEWAEWRWTGTRRDGSALHVAGTTVAGVVDGRIAWARLYMEEVEGAEHVAAGALGTGDGA